MRYGTKSNILFYVLGIIPVIWLALILAPYIDSGMFNIIKVFPSLIENPLNINFDDKSRCIKTVLIFLLIYFILIGIYETSKKNYRKGEEHGSAKWGNALTLNKKYCQHPMNENKILTQNVKIGLNGRKHRRNLNVLVCGGSRSRKN
jgi:type IV secretion system protein VirD4